jgi:two-component system chemotaxis response regulator CheB
MPHRDIIVVGASAGGVETLQKFFSAVSPDIPAAFFVVLHVQPHVPSYMPQLISRSSRMEAVHPRHNDRIRRGRIYVAPPDYHLLLAKGRVQLNHGPRENHHRPAIDPLFRTAAGVYGERAAGIVLSGTLDDGAAGLKEIQMKGGLTIVQDPADALYPDMPRNALAALDPDICAPVAEIPMLLEQSIQQTVEKNAMKRTKDKGTKPESKKMLSLARTNERLGAPSGFVCPECNGPLWEMKNGRSELYRCLVGHAYGPENLFAAQSEEVERSLWVALRALEERVELQHRLAQRSHKDNHHLTSKQFRAKATENAQHARLIREVLDKL